MFQLLLGLLQLGGQFIDLPALPPELFGAGMNLVLADGDDVEEGMERHAATASGPRQVGVAPQVSRRAHVGHLLLGAEPHKLRDHPGARLPQQSLHLRCAAALPR